MAPRTRSKRAAEKLAVQQLLASGQNAKGLLALPDELCLEIASHFPTVPVPAPLIRKDKESERYHHRYPALLSLSQTCRALRRVFLRYLWQRIEVHEQMKADERTLRNSGELYYCRTDKTHMKELVRQLEVVTIRDPSLAVHVNILNVAVPDHSFESVMEKLARCITLFPNLHTVQLRITACFKHQFFMSNVFKQYTYPQIRTVAICEHASPIMESCPRMVRLYAYDYLWCDDLDHVVEKRYPQLEVLGTPVNKRSLTKHSVETLVQSLPNLRDITLDRLALGLDFDWIKPLMQLRNLQTIRLRMDTPPPQRHRECAEWVKWSQHILSQNQNPDVVNKQVILTDPDRKVTVYVVTS